MTLCGIDTARMDDTMLQDSRRGNCFTDAVSAARSREILMCLAVFQPLILSKPLHSATWLVGRHYSYQIL